MVLAYIALLMAAFFMGFYAGKAYMEENKTTKVVTVQPKIIYKIFGMEIIKLCSEHVNLLPKKKLAIIDFKNCYFCNKK